MVEETDYEKLEHVGDSILGMVITTWLHETKPLLTIGTATVSARLDTADNRNSNLIWSATTLSLTSPNCTAFQPVSTAIQPPCLSSALRPTFAQR